MEAMKKDTVSTGDSAYAQTKYSGKKGKKSASRKSMSPASGPKCQTPM